MVAKELVDLFKEFNIIGHVGVDDFSDKLTFLYTLIIHLLSIVIVTSKSYVSSPISCYIPTTLSGQNFDKFVTNYCWVHGTIPLKPNEFLHEKEWEKADASRRITYYQWVPFVLGIQALCAYLPRLVWQMLCQSASGTDVESLLTLANKAVHSSPSERRAHVVNVADAMSTMIASQRAKSGSVMSYFARVCSCWRRNTDEGNSWSFGLRYLYLCVKIVYLLNAIGQLYFMQWFLGFPTFEFGFYVLKDLFSGSDWRYTLRFPRVTYCYVPNLKHAGSSSNVVSQCALPINMLNEKVFLFLWFWYVLLVVATTYSLLLWLVRILYTSGQLVFVRKYLRFMNNIPKNDYILWHLFTKKYLQGDGVFLLRMIKTNAGDLVAKETIEELWATYRKEFMHRDVNKFCGKEENPMEFALQPLHSTTNEKQRDKVPVSRRSTMLVQEKPLKGDFLA